LGVELTENMDTVPDVAVEPPVAIDPPVPAENLVGTVDVSVSDKYKVS
jgi:hypothetical protein